MGDVCQVLYKTKVSSYYRLCIVTATKESEDGLVRTVEIGLRNRRGGGGVGRSLPLERMNVGVQRLCLIVPRKEQSEAEVGLVERMQTCGKN